MSERRSPIHGTGHSRTHSAWRGFTRRGARRRSPRGNLEARLHRLARGSGVVVRADLLARLLRSDVRVVLLTAGAGFGKTTLLAQWAERDRRPFAWVSLDEAHDDPAALAADVARALDAVMCGREVVSAPWRALVESMRPFVLVLDDLHVLREPRCLALLAVLVEHLPPRSQLAIASRGEPDLPLARWSVQGELLRMGPGQLAMTAAEARLLLGADLDVGAAELDAMLRRTEGWAAGLSMAGRRLREGQLAGGEADGAGNPDRLVADYLRDEVLTPAGADMAQFLIRASVLDELSGPLCDAVLERSDSGLALRALERSALFVLPLDRTPGWYRCHPLLADVLRAELRLQDPAAEADLHRRASAWHEAHGNPERAIRHARAAGDARRAGDLVWANLLPKVCAGAPAPLAGWLAAFGDGEIAAQPALALAAALRGLERGDVAAARRWAAAGEAGAYEGALPGGPASAGAAAAIVQALAADEGLARMAEDAAHGAAGDGAAGAWRAICDLLVGIARRLSGDREGALASLTAAERAASAFSAAAPLAGSLAQLALLAADRDDWEAAAALVARAREVAPGGAPLGHACTIEVAAVSALVLARLGLSAEASREARRCRQLLSTPAHVPPWLAVDARVLLARACLLIGDASVARETLREARGLLARMPDVGLLGEQLERAWQGTEAYPLAGVIAPAPLSKAELRVLRFLPTHLSYREIGERLHVSQCTVKSQAHSAYRKLDVSSRSQAVERASALGLIRAIEGLSPKPLGGTDHDGH